MRESAARCAGARPAHVRANAATWARESGCDVAAPRKSPQHARNSAHACVVRLSVPRSAAKERSSACAALRPASGPPFRRRRWRSCGESPRPRLLGSSGAAPRRRDDKNSSNGASRRSRESNTSVGVVHARRGPGAPSTRPDPRSAFPSHPAAAEAADATPPFVSASPIGGGVERDAASDPRKVDASSAPTLPRVVASGRSHVAASVLAAYANAAACTPLYTTLGWTIARPMSNPPWAPPPPVDPGAAAPSPSPSPSILGSPVSRGSSSARRAFSATEAAYPTAPPPAPPSLPPPPPPPPSCAASEHPNASARHIVAASVWP